MPETHPKPIIIAGPTASGKTEIALALAKKTGGIIISADSRQVYKNLPVGTAAPIGDWHKDEYLVEGIPYYLVGIIDINERFDVSKFISETEKIIQKNKNRQIIFAGGTGMYLQGYFCGMDKLPQADEGLRAKLKDMAEKHGKQYLHDELAKVDAASAAEIPAGNLHRVMRALEIYSLTGQPASVMRTGKFNNNQITEKTKFICLNWDKELLNQRIAQRTNLIFKGMCEEAEAALKAGYAKDAPGLRSLGYQQAIEFLEGTLSKEAAVERISTLTRQYAKRQRTWFARYNANILNLNESHPFNAVELADKILAL